MFWLVFLENLDRFTGGDGRELTASGKPERLILAVFRRLFSRNPVKAEFLRRKFSKKIRAFH
jgi:hypothetical protein